MSANLPDITEMIRNITPDLMFFSSRETVLSSPLDAPASPHFQQPQWIGQVSLQHIGHQFDNHSGQRDQKAKMQHH